MARLDTVTELLNNESSFLRLCTILPKFADIDHLAATLGMHHHRHHPLFIMLVYDNHNSAYPKETKYTKFNAINYQHIIGIRTHESVNQSINEWMNATDL
jgi:hypothetical protein